MLNVKNVEDKSGRPIQKKKALEREKQKNFIPEVTGLKISNITNHHYSLKGSKLTG